MFIRVKDLMEHEFIVNIQHILQIRPVCTREGGNFAVDLNDNEGTFIRINETEYERLKRVLKNLQIMG